MTEQVSNETEVQTALFPGRFDSLTRIVSFVTRAARAAGLDVHSIDAVQLAVDEACSNIIEHAYGGESRGDIRCTCRVDLGKLTIKLNDLGAPFNPDVIPEPDLFSDIEHRSEGGLGLFLMRRLMDEVVFEFDPMYGNTLTMVKYGETIC